MTSTYNFNKMCDDYYDRLLDEELESSGEVADEFEEFADEMKAHCDTCKFYETCELRKDYINGNATDEELEEECKEIWMEEAEKYCDEYKEWRR